MLNVANVKNSSHGMSYYAKDNYYSNEHGVANSSWQGKGAEALGLSGNVDPEVFKELLEGKVDGQQLGKLDKDENGNVKAKFFGIPIKDSFNYNNEKLN